MPINPAVVGRALPNSSLVVDVARLSAFAHAIGETNPIYFDTDAAHAGGHPDVPVPPTFLFGVELESPEPFAWLSDLGVDLRHILHGDQRFVYSSIAHAGDTLVASPRIAEIYTKKGGALEFIVKQTSIARSDGTPVAELVSTIVVRRPLAAG